MPSGSPPGSLSHPRLFGRLVRLVYARSALGMIATVVNSSLLVYVLWEIVGHRTLLAWYLVLMLLTLIRMLGIRVFLKKTVPDSEIPFWGWQMVIGLGLAGLLWGMTGLVLFPAQSTEHQAFLALVLAGMVAGAVGTFSPMLPAFLAFTVPALVPLAFRFFLIGDDLHLAMAVMTLLFGVLTFLTARHFNHSTIELIELQETFAGQLNRRTAELAETNRQLRQEIAERNRAEAARQQSEERLSLAAEAVNLGIWGWWIEQGIVYQNDKWTEISGFSPLEVQNFSLDLWLSRVYPEDRPQLRHRIQAHFDGTTDRLECEYRIRHREKGLIWLYANCQVVLRDADAAPLHMVGVHYEITARKLLEIEREQLIRDLEKALSEVKKLSGFLPICAVCKKIRDDRGYWNQIETYLREHSEAIFSHGICPECAKKMYPDLKIGKEASE